MSMDKLQNAHNGPSGKKQKQKGTAQHFSQVNTK